jgi:hypothetical protein
MKYVIVFWPNRGYRFVVFPGVLYGCKTLSLTFRQEHGWAIFETLGVERGLFFFFLVSLGGVRLSPLGTSATVGLLYQPRMIDDDDYGLVGGMRIDRGNQNTRRKPAPVPRCPPQIPHDPNWDRTRAAAVGSRRLTA